MITWTAYKYWDLASVTYVLVRDVFAEFPTTRKDEAEALSELQHLLEEKVKKRHVVISACIIPLVNSTTSHHPSEQHINNPILKSRQDRSCYRYSLSSADLHVAD